jgi:hypothetical protein
LESYKLMEVELETCNSIINNLAEGMVESSHKPKTTKELAKNLERKCQFCVLAAHTSEPPHHRSS